jgi:hypothetical protein
MWRDRVRAIISNAQEVTPELPRPLTRELPLADPFPVQALGDVLALNAPFADVGGVA